MSLNKAQKAAVMHFEGPCLVLAGPGSGKTLTIAKRIEYLIKEYKVRPEEILVITFTKYAAGEMKKRFCQIMGTDEVPVNFGTFHSVYYWILKWAYGLNQGNLLLENEKYALLRKLSDSLEEEYSQDRGDDDLKGIAEEIGNIKNNRMDIRSYESRRYGKEGFKKIYLAYEETKKKLGKIDFEDMLLMCCRLFEERKDILKKWQERFRYILIDEFQDINQAQYDAIRMLAESENNLFVVGDDDQSVYGFRGARPGIMMKFKKDYPGAKEILLDVNYRSDARIVEGALKVISHNRERFGKVIRAAAKGEKEIQVLEFKDSLEESRYILKRLEKFKEKGVKLEQSAVLFRTAADALLLTEVFTQYQVPYHMRERIDNIYEHFIAQDMISYMKLAQGSLDRKHFLRVANRPKRYIGRDSMREEPVSFESFRRFYCDKSWMLDRIDRLEEDIMMLGGRTPYAAIQYIRKCIGYDEFLGEYARERGADHEKLKSVLDQIQESAKGHETMEEWFLHIEEYGNLLHQKAKEKAPDSDKKGVALHTMHGAKGLEYDIVFIIGANEGITPYKKAKLTKEIEEERRLFYVAMTRAKKELVISCTKERNGKNMAPSRFICELTGSQNRKNDVK